MIAASSATEEGLVVGVVADGTEVDVDGAVVDVGPEVDGAELDGGVEEVVDSGGELEGVDEHAAQSTANVAIATPAATRMWNRARAANVRSMPGASPSGPEKTPMGNLVVRTRAAIRLFPVVAILNTHRVIATTLGGRTTTVGVRRAARRLAHRKRPPGHSQITPK